MECIAIEYVRNERQVISESITNAVAEPKSIKEMLERVVEYNQNFQCPICLTLVFEPC